MKSNEIVITPTGIKKFPDEQKTVHFNDLEVLEDKLNIGGKISQAFENFQDGLQMLSEYTSGDEKSEQEDDGNTKLTIRGPGSYIKKLIQQFSEGPAEAEDSKPESDRTQPGQSIKERADAICKKCLHYKGKISK